MILTRGSCTWWKKSLPATLFQPQVSHGQAWDFNPDLREERLTTSRLSYDYGLSVMTPWLLTSSGFMYLHDVDNHTGKCKA
jgi:hypothetical protein